MTVQVEQLTAEVARLRAEGETASTAQAELREELAQRDERMRTLLAEREADGGRARAEAAQQREASERAAAAADVLEEHLRRELKALGARLERAEEVNPPPSVVSASGLAITILALLATSALAFWISAAKSARDQVQELEELRLQTEEQEVRSVSVLLDSKHLVECARNIFTVWGWYWPKKRRGWERRVTGL